MLLLTPDQARLVDSLQASRQAAGLASLLAGVWPDLARQLQERWQPFVAAALQHAGELGFDDPGAQARYTALCCLWGSNFEDREGFAWAAGLARDRDADPALRLHQLEHHSRLLLQQRTAAAPAGSRTVQMADFDAALQALDDGLADALGRHGVYIAPALRRRLQPCDLGSVRVAVVAASPLKGHVLDDGAWRRVDVPAAAAQPLVLSAPAPEPLTIDVLSHPAGGSGMPARLHLAVAALTACALHPRVEHDGPQGQQSWQGAATARLSIPLHAPDSAGPAPVDPTRATTRATTATSHAGSTASPAGIAHASPPALHTLQVVGCGVRDVGAAFPQAVLALRVHPCTQWLLQVRHAASPAVTLPADAGAADASLPAARPTCLLEADGQPCDVSAWQGAWQSLQARAQAGLERLANAWQREMADGSGRLQATLSPLAGQAALAWGWQHTAEGTAALRVQGGIDFTAIALDLVLSGDIAWQGGRARVRLQAQGRSLWQQAIDVHGANGTPGQGLEQAVCAWSHPCVLGVEAVATGEPGLLSAQPLPAALCGAVVGECGLRPRPDGLGWQWFYRLSLEPVHAALLLHDPVAGTISQQRQLLPGMVLVDWSAG